MRPENQSCVSEFLLLGLPIQPEQQGLFFALFLCMYLTTVLGNLLIILLIRLDSRLHTPMYFFLSHLAFSDISLSSVTVPKMLMNMQSRQQTIPYSGCISQFYFLTLFGCIDNFLLAVMAYDRYVAICQPLHYTNVMRQELLISLVVWSWFLSCAHALLHTLLLVQLSFCADNSIPHFFCDLTALLKMSCSDISLNELIVIKTEGPFVIMVPFMCIIISYLRIFTTVLKIPSAAGKYKVFSTCGSHLTVVILFYGSVTYVYLQPLTSNNVKDRIATVIYTILTPMLNPFVYSLRNKDMKQGLGKLIGRIKPQLRGFYAKS
uniref:Olfactory receptor n=1 Tax=Equus asinus TaxID=9793 RepID=A0A8C4MQY8_EQUAS